MRRMKEVEVGWVSRLLCLSRKEGEEEEEEEEEEIL